MIVPTPLVPVRQPKVSGPVIVAVMDGIGIGPSDAGNAVTLAHTPVLDQLSRGPLSLALKAHGTAVGLSADTDMGNSEVGHNALGAGRIFDQGAKRVAQAVATGAIFEQPIWGQMVARCHQGGALHLLGLLSDGNIHSHIGHALALIARAHALGVERLFVHALLDGRDVGKTSAHQYIEQLETALQDINRVASRCYRIASGGGRMHLTMDRYQADWPMVTRGWQVHVRGQGRQFVSALSALETLRKEHPGIGDQDLGGFVVAENGKPVGAVHDGDSMIAFNFRGDRMLQWVDAMEQDTFHAFERGPRPDVLFAGMTLYDGDTHRPKNYLVAPPVIEHTLGELMAQAGITQLACSETQKFGHVTYFWNGNKSGAFDARTERYIEVPSLNVPFNRAPAMAAQKIADTVVAELTKSHQKFTRVNFANGDMVGHTGDFNATVAAVEAVDKAIGTLLRFTRAHGGALLVTADHGNAEDMLERDTRTGTLKTDQAGRYIPKTSHSCNPVPLHIDLPQPLTQAFTLDRSITARGTPGLSHVAATCLTLMGYRAPPHHFDPSLIVPSASGR
jgi:2,3-bisphosphoglycerate-independent phosphoglycerate mutase